jgi:tRNA-guanine family transglycosylase
MACGQDFYSRAYIHHLYQAKELLAQILLMGHNLHHMLEFCWVATQAQQEEQKQQQLHRQDDDQQPPAFDTFLQRCKRECGR